MKALLPLLALPALLPGCAGPAAVDAVSLADTQASAAVAAQVRRCYRDPRVPSSGRSIVTRLFARYTAEGMLVGVPLLVSQQGLGPENQPYASRMAEAAKVAVMRCSPVSFPQEAGKKRASDFLLTFSPRRSA
ncbi:MAG TPA: hypothetical protein VF548_07590 [Allosphingosinicella sp.]|jgi:hypothetical protein